jgi:holo-[acyl-carrier protein] synthase
MSLHLGSNEYVAFRIGTDLVAVASVEDALAAHGDRYLERVFTHAEVADCTRESGAVDATRLAARFAAKEAVMKVLQPVDEALPWRTIEVVKRDGGSVGVALAGNAAQLAAAAGLDDFALSLTHEAGFASAVAMAEVGGRRKGMDE